MIKEKRQQLLKKSEERRVAGSMVKKAILPSFCFAVLSTVAFETSIHAAQTTSNVLATTTKYVNVTSGSLNLRKGASSSAAIITSLAKGTTVTVYTEANGWSKVKANGKDGYVSTSFLSAKNPASSTTAPSATTSTTKYVNVSSGSLNMRKSASTSSAVISSLSKGTAVTVYSEANGWAKVKANGKDGYVSTSFLSPKNPASPTTGPSKTTSTTKYVNVSSGSLNMRNGASTNASIIVKLAKGAAVKVYSEAGGWAKIEAYGKTGYVSSTFLAVTLPGAGNSASPQKTTTKYVNVGSNSSLNIRKSASASSAVLGKLANGAQVTVYTESNGWAKVKVNGQEGYVSSDYLSASKSNTTNVTEDKQKAITKYVFTDPGSTLSMYKSASTNASILVKLARGVEVTVISEASGWAKIETYGQTGYVRSQYLSAAKPAPGMETPTDNSSKPSNEAIVEKYVNVIYGSSLNMRSAASATASIVTKLARGTIVNVNSEANGWAKVTANGKTGYVSSQYLSTNEPFNPNTTSSTIEKVYQNYGIGLTDLVTKEMAANPQTDKPYVTYISAEALTLINDKSGIVNGTGWNVRGGAGTTFWTVGQVNNKDTLQILAKVTGKDGHDWYQVKYNKTWVNASPEDVSYYLDPKNFLDSTVDSLQFLKLSVTANLNANEVNDRILSGKGILQGLASTFIEAGTTYSVNEFYLISHALLETSNGTSQLAKGVQINGKTVYNMYGIGAYDSSAVTSGAQFAYNAGWFTPEAAIIGGAGFIANGYINAGQDTLYKMRWNPSSIVLNGYASHQYATDIGWAAKQTDQIYNLYKLIESYKLVLEIPQYK